MPNDFVISLVRTWVPVGVGSAIAWLAATLGVVIDTDTSTHATLAATGIVIAAYYVVARLVEAKYPQVGRILLALGMTKSQPQYKVIPGKVLGSDGREY